MRIRQAKYTVKYFEVSQTMLTLLTLLTFPALQLAIYFLLNEFSALAFLDGFSQDFAFCDF